MKGGGGGERTRQDSTFPPCWGSSPDSSSPTPLLTPPLGYDSSHTAVARMLGGNIKGRGLLGLNKAEVGKIYSPIFLSDISATQDFSLLCSLSIHPLYVRMFGCVKVLPRSLMINGIQTFVFENHCCRYWTLLSTLLLSSCNLQPPEAPRVHGF